MPPGIIVGVDWPLALLTFPIASDSLMKPTEPYRSSHGSINWQKVRNKSNAFSFGNTHRRVIRINAFVFINIVRVARNTNILQMGSQWIHIHSKFRSICSIVSISNFRIGNDQTTATGQCKCNKDTVRWQTKKVKISKINVFNGGRLLTFCCWQNVVEWMRFMTVCCGYVGWIFRNVEYELEDIWILRWWSRSNLAHSQSNGSSTKLRIEICAANVIGRFIYQLQENNGCSRGKSYNSFDASTGKLFLSQIE